MAKQYDVLIIGSGHSGGMAANILTKAGADCLMLDAGPVLDYERHFTDKAAHELPYRGFLKPGRLKHVYQADAFNANRWVDEEEVPYTHPDDAQYNWVRVRLVGGRSHFWSRMSYRLSDYEFKAKDHDGWGENWPISHADLSPYYDRVEEIFRVNGRKEGWEQLPDGNFIDNDSPESESMSRFIASAGKLGIPVTKGRFSAGQGPLASSVNLLLPEAMETGKLTISPNSIAREVTVDKNTGLVNGAYFLDRHSRREMHARARIVVLAAGCLESTRLLLNSGIANASGVLGHYLADQFYGGHVIASVPEAQDGKATRELIGGGAYIPRFTNLKGKRQEKDFLRGYALSIGSGGTPNRNFLRSYGFELQKKIAHYGGSAFTAQTMGDVLPRFENHVRINKDKVDAWGIPVLHIDARYSDNEYKMAKHAMDTMEETFVSSGFEIVQKYDRFHPPGYSIHEQGTCRMGDDPKTSVLNQWNQSHDIRNLFVVDAGSFVTPGPQNPTMTILALAMRSAEYLADQMNKRNL